MFNKKGRLSQVWSFDANSRLLSAAIINDADDGKQDIMFGTKNGKLIVIDKDAKIRWVFNAQESMSQVEMMFVDEETVNSVVAAPVLADLEGNGTKQVVFASELGVVYALNHDGRLFWKFACGGAVRGAIELADINNDKIPELLIGCMDGFLYVLNHRGKLLWKYNAKSPIEGSPLVVPKLKQIVFGDSDGNINAISLEGKLLWQYKTEGKIVAKPAAGNLNGNDEIVLLLGSTDNSLYALDSKGRLRWDYPTEGSINCEAVLADINKDGKLEVIFGSCDNRVYALNCDGEKIWSFETNFWIATPPIIADLDGDGKLEVIVGSYDQHLYILDSEGAYVLDHIPGLGGVVHQQGHYSEVQTQEAGDNAAKKIWQLKIDGIIVGCAFSSKKKNIIVNTKEGRIANIIHTKE